MQATISLVCAVLAFVLFVIAGFRQAEPYRLQLIAVGLAAFTVAAFVGKLSWS